MASHLTNANFSMHTGAKGGGTLGRSRDFLKEPVEFRRKEEGDRQSADVVGVLADEDQNYAKGQGDKLAKRTGNKSLPAVKPRS